MPENDRYNLTRSNWIDFYQELEDAISAFGLKSPVYIFTDRSGSHALTKLKNIISFYPQITQSMVKSQYEIMWSKNSREGLGRYPRLDYGAAADDVIKQ